ncbi:MAG: aminopeptidase [Saprospiraceae bacterium]|nr:aminopeptidase [Saprospiraceae bacterium]MBK9222795.1 aminopeptidase [Saprospiraceae bacterium]
MNWIEKYAHLLVNYSLYLKEGETVFIRTTCLAEPLVKCFYKEAIQKGAIVEVEFSFEDQETILLSSGNETQLNYLSASYKEAIQNFDAYLVIRAPYNSKESFIIPDAQRSKRLAITSIYDALYFKRLGDASLKRSLCQFPTEYAALLAGMTLETYTEFIQNACFLNSDDPAEKWKSLSKMQASIVAYLNTCDKIIYRNSQFEISFSVKNRIWINSDGKANMPSGEVFTSPIEESVNGEIYFNYPSIMMGEEVCGVRLYVERGEIKTWSAEIGQHILDRVFQIPGSRWFGEVAIATNQNIQQATKNILFDEKIGGTVHMAVGQSYLQTGGKNHSSIHWDLITDMKDSGEIIADDKLIYQHGKFLI